MFSNSIGRFLVNGLVALALAWQFAGTVADFVERPDAPNLYWALTAMPRPLIDLRRARDVEYRMLERVYPELGDLNRERTAGSATAESDRSSLPSRGLRGRTNRLRPQLAQGTTWKRRRRAPRWIWPQVHITS